MYEEFRFSYAVSLVAVWPDLGVELAFGQLGEEHFACLVV